MREPTFCLVILCCLCLSCSPENTFITILETGAVPDGKTLNTKSIQQAIDQAAISGKQVVIPEGTFLTGSLTVKSGTEIVLQKGAVLLASAEMGDYTQESFIYGKDLESFSLTGQGTINGNGLSFFDKKWKFTDRPQPWIHMENSRNLSVSGITLENSPSHCLVFTGCDSVTVDGIKIFNDARSPNTDGIDINNTKNVRITNCEIRTGDDAICIKNKKRGETQYITENVFVSNCILESDDAALKLGTGSSHITRNCVFKDIKIENTRYGIALFMSEGGTYSDVTFQQIEMTTGGRRDDQYAIFADIHRKTKEKPLGKIRNISFEDLNISTSGLIYLAGHPESVLENISFHNVSVNVKDPYDHVALQWSKPTGNKKVQEWDNTVSYVGSSATAIFANIQGLTLKNFSLQYTDVKDQMTKSGLHLINTPQPDTVNVMGNSIGGSPFMTNADL